MCTTTNRPAIRIAAGTLAVAAAMVPAPFAVSAASADSIHAACPPSQNTHQCHQASTGTAGGGATTTGGVVTTDTTPQVVEVVATQGPVVLEGTSPVPNQNAQVPTPNATSTAVPQQVPQQVPTATPTATPQATPDQIINVATSYGPTVVGGYSPVPAQNAQVPTPNATPTAVPQQVPHQVPTATPTATPILEPQRVSAVSSAGVVPTTAVPSTTTEPTVATTTTEPTVTTTTTEPTVTTTKAQVLAHTGIDDNTILIGGVAAAVILAGAGFVVIARRRVED